MQRLDSLIVKLIIFGDWGSYVMVILNPYNKRNMCAEFSSRLFITIIILYGSLLLTTIIAGSEQYLFAGTLNHNNNTESDNSQMSKNIEGLNKNKMILDNTQSKIGDRTVEGEKAQETTTDTDWIYCFQDPNNPYAICHGTDNNDQMRAGNKDESISMMGHNGDDVLIGSSSNDQLSGNLGNDIVDSRGGNDTVSGAAGDDYLNGGTEDDLLYGGEGNDRMYGGPGVDNFWGQEGDDYMDGGDGDDSMVGDFFVGQNGADVIIGGLGNDKIYHSNYPSSNGPDTTSADGLRDMINCGAGIDEVWINFGEDKDTVLNCENVHYEQGYSDGDEISDPPDNCPFIANRDQKDSDSDAKGDACDTDDDNDGIEDSGDNCRTIANRDQSDFDDDGKGDLCDLDKDGDGTPDRSQRFPEREQTID